MKFPEKARQERLVAKNATRIRKAFKSGLDGEAIARAWVESHPAGGSVSPQMARDWAKVHIHPNKKPMQNALKSVYGDSYILGERIATARLSGLKKDASVITPSIVDWDTWKPGLPSAAALIRPRGSLAGLLDSQSIQISDEVVATKLDRIGTALANALEKGFNMDKTAQMIDAVINDPEAAMVIARTETSRAVSVATRDKYEKAGIEKVIWIASDSCDLCAENADASPIGIDEEFPSGDTEPPAHPNCECALGVDVSDYFDENLDEEI